MRWRRTMTMATQELKWGVPVFGVKLSISVDEPQFVPAQAIDQWPARERIVVHRRRSIVSRRKQERPISVLESPWSWFSSNAFRHEARRANPLNNPCSLTNPLFTVNFRDKFPCRE